MAMLKWFPLLLISLVFYNLLVYGGTLFVPDGETVDIFLARDLISPTMFSGEVWHLRLGDFVVFLSLCFLFVEIVKSTRTTAIEVVNHGLSMLVFVVALVEFVTLQRFATSTFFFITVMAFFDVVAGFTISIVAAKRDLGVAGGLIGTN
jgi:hypothetical protein